jgi:hypothetical protein
MRSDHGWRLSIGASVALLAAATSARATSLYNNGGLVTNPGAGFNGADVSQASTDIAGGVGSTRTGTTIRKYTDDFVVPAGGWTVNSATGYVYITATYPTFPPSITLTAITAQIWSAVPSGVSTGVIATSTTIIDNSWTGIYRTPNGNLLDNTSPIMAVTADFGSLSLNPGTYWISFGFTGTAPGGSAGGLTPYVMSVDGSGNPVTNTGNARQGTSPNGGASYTWNAQQTSRGGVELPFLINGTPAPAPGAGAIVCITGLIAARRRRS